MTRHEFVDLLYREAQELGVDVDKVLAEFRRGVRK